jgi:PadR family transcriptional regulator, regulatory protein PadR
MSHWILYGQYILYLDILYIIQYNLIKCSMETNQDPAQNILLEVRRGVLAIAVLSQLSKEQYGYSLLKLLADQGLEIDQSTLYPLLRRLEAQGLLRSDWRIADESRPRRYYIISPRGQAVLSEVKEEWFKTVTTLSRLLSKNRE